MRAILSTRWKCSLARSLAMCAVKLTLKRFSCSDKIANLLATRFQRCPLLNIPCSPCSQRRRPPWTPGARKIAKTIYSLLHEANASKRRTRENCCMTSIKIFRPVENARAQAGPHSFPNGPVYIRKEKEKKRKKKKEFPIPPL